MASVVTSEWSPTHLHTQYCVLYYVIVKLRAERARLPPPIGLGIIIIITLAQICTIKISTLDCNLLEAVRKRKQTGQNCIPAAGVILYYYYYVLWRIIFKGINVLHIYIMYIM